MRLVFSPAGIQVLDSNGDLTAEQAGHLSRLLAVFLGQPAGASVLAVSQLANQRPVAVDLTIVTPSGDTTAWHLEVRNDRLRMGSTDGHLAAADVPRLKAILDAFVHHQQGEALSRAVSFLTLTCDDTPTDTPF